MELLEFIFSDIWHFLGTVYLTEVLLKGFIYTIRAIKGTDRRIEITED